MGGLQEPTQILMCRPGSSSQFQNFLLDLDQRLFTYATKYYAEMFLHTQGKLAAIPQIPVAARPETPGMISQYIDVPEVAQMLEEPELVARYSRYLPLRGWLIRYHFKLAMFAEAINDRDTAQRCLWLAYIHLVSYLAEISSGAYLPPDSDTLCVDKSGAPVGWMWRLNGGDADGTRAHSLRMFGRRWDEAMDLANAVNLRLVRGWMYQLREATVLRQNKGTSSTGWPYGFGSSGGQQILVNAVSRSGIRAVGRPAVNVSPGATHGAGVLAASVTGGNGSLDPLVLSVHAGECTPATEQLMNVERRQRQRQRQRLSDEKTFSSSLPACFVALGTETIDVDLVEGTGSWWPLGGHYGVIDFSRPGEASRPGLIINSSSETTGICSMLPIGNQYDVFLTLAARQYTEHMAILVLVLQQAGFGSGSSYFWAVVSALYADMAVLQNVAKQIDFGGALDRAATHMAADTVTGTGAMTQQGVREAVDRLVGALRPPVAGPTHTGVVEVAGSEVMGWPFAGFAFERRLTTQSLNIGLRDQLHLLNSGSGSGSGVRDRVFPQWTWASTAAPLLHAAAQAGLRRIRAFAEEKTVYLTESGCSTPGRCFSACPGVENTYVAIWLVAERKRHEQHIVGVASLRQLAKALVCVANGDSVLVSEAAAHEVITQPSESMKLKQVVKQTGNNEAMELAGCIAEMQVELGRPATALGVFLALAERFRANGWAVLTACALRWVVRCAVSVDDPPSAIEATLELLSSQLVASVDDRQVLHGDLLRMLAEDSPGCGEISVDMHRVYAPITCHAHWRHWMLPDDMRMTYQVVLDGRALVLPLSLVDLRVRFGDSRFDVHVTGESTGIEPQTVDVAGFDQPVEYLSLGTTSAESSSSLVLQPGRVLVIEGVVTLDDAYAERRPAGDVLTIEEVAATVGDGWRLQMRWPTCAPPSNAEQNTATSGIDDDEMTSMERLLLGNIGVARMRDPALGESSQLWTSLGSGHAVSRAINATGPSASLSQNRRWLSVSSSTGVNRWVTLLSPPLTPRKQSQASVPLREEPAFSVYSRCRTLYLAEPQPMVQLSAPQVADLAPAYRGEMFPVEVCICNLHKRKSLDRVWMEFVVGELGQVAGSLNNIGGGLENTGLGIENRGVGPWISVENDRDAEQKQSVVVELSVDIKSGQKFTATVYVHFPAPLLSGSWKPSTVAAAAGSGNTAVVRVSARYAHSDEDLDQNRDCWWSGTASLQVSVPVVSPLYAQAERLPGHVPAPSNVVLASTGVPATRMGGDSEYCLRRPILVKLFNNGPWDIAVDILKLRPSIMPASLGFRMQLAGSSVCLNEAEDGQYMVISAGGFVQHVFWLDVFTHDLVRLPEDLCPGTLQVTWRRLQETAQTIRSLLWIPPLRLVEKQVQVESSCSSPVAKVGHPLSVIYRILNPTHLTKTVETSMHASDGFVFSGPRRTTLNVLPGHVALLRFILVPVSAAAAAPPVSESDVYAPSQLLFGLKQQMALLAAQGKPMPPGNVAGHGWVLLPKLDVRLAARHRVQVDSRTGALVAPPPTRTISTVAVSADALAPGVSEKGEYARVRRMLLEIAGLDSLDDGLLGQELVDEYQQIVPEYLLHAGEVQDEEDGGRVELVDGNTVVRLDQTFVFCVPE
ncbi:hypothetical protein LPJ57_001089 [Coemansia sp. RSA 486]|nr:hypothetical protein LPJ57_001089 [Coemansia sp. RSA 486]